MTTDALSKLPPLSWRGIVFPYNRLKTDFAHRVGEHDAIDVDGERLESTGLKARVVSCTAIFQNVGAYFYPTQYTAPWFPDVFLQFIAAMEDRSTGTLVHPTRGPMQCKPLTGSDVLDAARRDGTSIDVVWKETNDASAFGVEAPKPGAAALAVAAARVLDTSIANLKPPPPAAAMPTASFSDMVNSVVAVADAATMTAARAKGSFDSIIYQANRLRDAMNRTSAAATTTGLAVSTSVTRLVSSMHDMKLHQKKSARVTKAYPVAQAMTLGRIATLLGAKVDDLIALNPSLLNAALVPRGALVTYYG